MSTKSSERHNERGEEVLDPVPKSPPVHAKKTMSLYDQIRQQVRLQKILEDEAIAETEEEADDFEIGDDFQPLSKHENDHIPSVKDLKAQVAGLKKAVAEANRRAAVAAHEKEKAAGTPPAVNPGADPSPESGSA